MTDIREKLLGIPVIYDKYVPKNTMYFINKNMIVFGLWEPRKYPTVSSIIASQRRRRHK